MIETVLISVSCVISVLAGVFSLVALKAADPLELRRISAFASGTAKELQNKLQDLEEVQLVRLEARCDAILERAEQKFESAEHKRKSVAARGNRNAALNQAGDGVPAWMDESLSRQERHAAIERVMRGGNQG